MAAPESTQSSHSFDPLEPGSSGRTYCKDVEDSDGLAQQGLIWLNAADPIGSYGWISSGGAAFTKGTCREIRFRLYRNGRRAARWHPSPCTSHPMRERCLSRRLCRSRWRCGRRSTGRRGNNQSSPPRDARHWTARQHGDKGDRTRLRVRERSKSLPLTVLNQPLRRSVPDRRPGNRAIEWQLVKRI